MLSLRELRQHVDPVHRLEDQQLQSAASQLRELAQVVLDSLEAARLEVVPEGRTHARFLRLVPPLRREEAEERAAIREFDGGLSRSDAELATLHDLGLVGGRS